VTASPTLDPTVVPATDVTPAAHPTHAGSAADSPWWRHAVNYRAAALPA
jgi:hypothetical protein